ncbi:hypothetical protein B0H13DRAFT_2014848 [Mycena leptocephala]|nr:hypothetical protein B0H13DRAFT_2014848 [Mycena leptocephala]
MSLFSNTSSIIIQGGTFYSTAGDVTIQINHQLAIEVSETHLALDQGSTHIWEEYPEGGSSGPAQSSRTWAEAETYLPYDIGSSTQYRSSECPTTTAAFDLGTDSSNPYVGWEESMEPVSEAGIVLNAAIGAAGGSLGSVAHFPCPSELPSTSTSSSASLFAPGTDFASVYSPVAVDGLMLPPSTITQ